MTDRPQRIEIPPPGARDGGIGCLAGTMMAIDAVVFVGSGIGAWYYSGSILIGLGAAFAAVVVATVIGSALSE